MTASDMPLRDSALAVAAGDMAQAAMLYKHLQRLLGRLASYDEEVREYAAETVMRRWHDSLQRNFESLRDHSGMDASAYVKSCSRRGANLDRIEGRLGRTLSDDELQAFDPFVDDEGVTGYFLTALRNAARDEVRRRKAALERKRRVAAEPGPEQRSPADGIPGELLARAEKLLVDEFLLGFRASNPREWDSLRQIEAGKSVGDIAREALGPQATEEALARRKTLVYQHWSRARLRLIRAVERTRGNKEFRTVIVPAIKILIDERYRRKVKPVRKADSTRLLGSTGESR